MCPVDSGTINSILRDTKYFLTLTKRQENVITIAGRDATIVGSGCVIVATYCIIVSRFNSYLT
jgi:hypothetical protein